MPVVVSGADGQTAQNTRGDSQVPFLDKLLMPVVVSGVEIPQVPFLDKLFMHVVVSGADGQTAQNTRGDFTGRRHPRRGAEVAPAELLSSERVFLQSPRQPCLSRHPSLKFRQFYGVCPARSRCEVWDARTRL